ncbi:DNA-binding MarR family transcriptional regulator [Xanthobacter flavus]|uniref:DNA-binding MarR family transcriptional regulator n=1 Tax=Xanthobacter flavus TaxID=281 RepID=A0A9W6CHA1_XANFL|nr:MarR family transcriptional regulator [Xanthobacter flavus]MDR6333574.1 DNA-binding MarR family transcriptional regulator [Xanthobacter flavus]GLI20674.1 hypothetical protein XFLAVUS301_03480 [Xanthobacter flavus]
MTSVSELTDHTGFRMRMVSNAVSQAFARKVEAEGVTVAEWVFLRALYNTAPMPPSVLAGSMGMTRGAISKLADRLLEKGLIERTDSPSDKRAHSLSLSAEGQAKVPVLAALADENDAAFFGVLTPAEHRQLDHLLTVLAERSGLRAAPVD